MPSATANVEVEATIDFEVFCARCGAGICGNCTDGNTPNRGMPYIQVEPCQRCIEDAEEKEYDKGYDNGYRAREMETE